MKLLKRLFGEEEGAGVLEYALLVALIAIAVIGGVTFFGEALNVFFQGLSGQIPF